jgi:MYXO-CTERM domain-containing protein
VNYLLRRLSQNGLRRTLAGGHWAWAALALAAYALRRARRPVADVRMLRIRPGERFVVGLVSRTSTSDATDPA